MHLILLDRFWFVYIPFIRMVKFQFLALLSGGSISVYLCDITYLFLREFAPFVNYISSVGFVSITLVALVLRWYFVGSFPLAKCWWKIKVVEKNEDVVRFLKEGFNDSMKYRGLHWYVASSSSKERM